MSGKYFTLILLKIICLLGVVGVVRSWSSANYSNHKIANTSSSSQLNTMLMMNDLCELPLDQLLKVKKSLRELHLSDNNQESPLNKVESRSIDDEDNMNMNYNSNYAAQSIAMNAIAANNQRQLQQQQHFNRFQTYYSYEITKFSFH